jgi:hypothetical protein
MAGQGAAAVTAAPTTPMAAPRRTSPPRMPRRGERSYLDDLLDVIRGETAAHLADPTAPLADPTAPLADPTAPLADPTAPLAEPTAPPTVSPTTTSTQPSEPRR